MTCDVSIVIVIIIFIVWTSGNANTDAEGLGSYFVKRCLKFFSEWPDRGVLAKGKKLCRADPNIPNGILSTGDNLKCLKRLRLVQQPVLQIQIWR